MKAIKSTIIFFTLLTKLSAGQDFPPVNPETYLSPAYDLVFDSLPQSWDEGIPLGNGMLGALVWQKGGKLRISLDRADLWDLRPTANQERPEWKFSWVKEQWEKDNYGIVQELFDVPYDRDPGPTKIPAGAVEFNTGPLGDVISVRLRLKDAVCEIAWQSGATMKIFIRADELAGFYRFEGTETPPVPVFVPPAFTLEGDPGEESPVTGQDLRRLGYPGGITDASDNSVVYDQNGWGGFKYQVSVRWENHENSSDGCWSISSEFPGWERQAEAIEQTQKAMAMGFDAAYAKHEKSWKHFWSLSGIEIPDSILARQWHLEMYKLKAASGNGAPPISLQAVWTADNGKLPPWKGDFHNDLNTQLSYWPSYSSNHLEEAMGFIDWLERNKPEFERYTREYYGTSGLNAPGVSTLTGQPMGGWIQYSFGPTVSAWLGHHYYLQWRYSMDRDFLEEKAYPWISAVAVYLEELSGVDENGLRKLPLSSSPEIFDNSREAWFETMTNFDLGMARWTFEKAAELARELGRTAEAERWRTVLAQWPEFDVDPESGLTFAKGFPYEASHRHFSHLVAFHPLGIIDISHGEKEAEIIRSTIATLDRHGPDWWCGYSYGWLGNLKARAFDGEGAAEALRTFATCFCLPNSFHVNGDQSGTGKSQFTYRPFTLEGNFAFAAGIQEMLIQSHSGTVKLFPAIPESWDDAAFYNLRAEGAFLVSAAMNSGRVESVAVFSEKGGDISLENPFAEGFSASEATFVQTGDVIQFHMNPGDTVRLKIK